MAGGGQPAYGMMISAGCALALSGCTAEHSPQDQSSDPPAPRTAAAPCPAQSETDFIWIAGGVLEKGTDAQLPEESRKATVPVAGFWIGAHEVTTADFAEFVRATSYVTIAERPAPDMPRAGSAVFTVPLDGNPNWWRWVDGAQWRTPAGPGGSAPPSPREPVVQIAYEDALAFAQWRGMALPSEDQWEWAARSGGANSKGPSVDAANVYQGSFPLQNTGADGFVGRAPVGCFPADKNGVYDLIGNVWEWTSSSEGADRNVIKGGSFLCAANYCARYRPAARQFQERSLGTDHIGMRLVDPNRPPPAP